MVPCKYRNTQKSVRQSPNLKNRQTPRCSSTDGDTDSGRDKESEATHGVVRLELRLRPEDGLQSGLRETGNLSVHTRSSQSQDVLKHEMLDEK